MMHGTMDWKMNGWRDGQMDGGDGGMYCRMSGYQLPLFHTGGADM